MKLRTLLALIVVSLFVVVAFSTAKTTVITTNSNPITTIDDDPVIIEYVYDADGVIIGGWDEDGNYIDMKKPKRPPIRRPLPDTTNTNQTQ